MKNYTQVAHAAFKDQFELEKDAYVREWLAARKATRYANKAEKSLKNYELWGDASKKRKLVNQSVEDTKAYIGNMRGEAEAQYLAMRTGRPGRKYMTLSEHNVAMDKVKQDALKAGTELESASYKAGRNTGFMIGVGSAAAGAGGYALYKRRKGE